MPILESVQQATGNQTFTYSKPMNHIQVINDGAAAMTLSIGGMPVPIRATDASFEADVNPFTSVTVTTTGSYRISVYS